MKIIIHPHALERMRERGATEEEVIITIERGERFAAKYDRVGFRKNFPFENQWREKRYRTKQVEVYAVKENSDWIVVTVLTRYF
ncbi:MAG: DUF4258 domain-containing protein [Deltaproteobacteria bacterium]|nr:DUF4258 domain-containing protein [Deltaproteobacteria bacterium]